MNVKLDYLYQRYIDETCTEAERTELFSIIAANPGDPEIAALLDGTWNKINTAELQSLPNADGMLDQILSQRKKMGNKKISWYRPIAAASIVIALSAAIYLYTSRNSATDQNTETVSDIAPGTNKAILTLANGKVITLDNATAGEIARQAGIVISKTQDGQLVYDIAEGQKDQSTGSLAYNTIATPRGGQYKVNLPDGTKIWLNAASSLKYPAAFNGKQRRVELSGEAYFEVAKDKKRPFIVATRNQKVEVLGTHFNINSYADEGNTKTTLLEGSVQLSSLVTPKTDGYSQKSRILKPGEQAIFEGNDFKIAQADVELEMAWKNGDFVFRGEQLESVLRKIARWYDVEIDYAPNAPKEVALLGYMSRSRNISAVLRHLERTGEVKFKLNGRKITVLSNYQ